MASNWLGFDIDAATMEAMCWRGGRLSGTFCGRLALDRQASKKSTPPGTDRSPLQGYSQWPVGRPVSAKNSTFARRASSPGLALVRGRLLLRLWNLTLRLHLPRPTRTASPALAAHHLLVLLLLIGIQDRLD